MKGDAAVTFRSGKAPRYAVLLGVLALVGCDVGANGRKIQYMPDMADSPAPKTQKEYLEPPEGAVPMTANFYPKTVEDAEKMLPMPPEIANDPQAAQKGEVLFNTFCVACHGPGANGKNHLGPNFPQPPDIRSDAYKAHADGFFFYRITFGSASTIMPSYGHAISPFERWQIVAYVRNLQKAGK